MPSIKIKETESFDVGLRKFRRACERAGIVTEVRKREFFEKPTEERKRKAAAAVKRNYKRVMKELRSRHPNAEMSEASSLVKELLS